MSLFSTPKNFRGIIKQKLTQARERKLNQPKSTPMTPEPLLTPTSQNSGQQPDFEKQMLLDLLEKTQKLAEEAQKNSYKQKKDYEARIQELLDELNLLKTENYELKRNQTKAQYGKAEQQLLEELKEFEKLSDQRETNYKLEIESLKNQLNQFQETTTPDLHKQLKEAQTEISQKDQRISELQLENQVENERFNQQLKEQMEKKIETILKISCEREAELSEELQRLRTSNSKLSELSSRKQQEFTQTLSKLQNQLKELENNYQQLHNSLLWERENFHQEKQQLIQYNSLKPNNRTQESLRSEISKLMSQLTQKDQVITELKLQKTNPQEKVPQVVSALNSIEQELSALGEYMRECDKEHTEEEEEYLEEIKSLNEEITYLREKLEAFEDEKLEEEISRLKAELQKVNSEKEHAEKMWDTYYYSLKKLQTEQEKTPEHSILEQEKQNLIEVHSKQISFYEAEFEQLKKVIESLKHTNRQKTFKLDSLKQLKNNDEINELNAWKLRREALLEHNKQLENYIKLLKSKQMKKLNQQELQTLKDKLQNSNKAFEELSSEEAKKQTELNTLKLQKYETSEESVSEKMNKLYQQQETNFSLVKQKQQEVLNQFTSQIQQLQRCIKEITENQTTTFDQILKISQTDSKVIKEKHQLILDLQQKEFELLKNTVSYEFLDQLYSKIKEQETQINSFKQTPGIDKTVFQQQINNLKTCDTQSLLTKLQTTISNLNNYFSAKKKLLRDYKLVDSETTKLQKLHLSLTQKNTAFQETLNQISLILNS